MSLERKLEPEVMDTVEEAIAYDKMDHSTVNQLFVDDLISAIGPGLDAVEYYEILDLGTGTAQIPIELAGRDERFRILAVDAAASMLDMARINIEVTNMTQQILLDRADAKSMPYDDSRFDAVMSNSIIHHLPDPSAALAESVRVLKPGGLLFFRDLMRPATNEEITRLVKEYAGDEESHAQQMFDDSLRAALDLEEIRGLITTLGFDAESVQPTSDRHWTWSALKPS